MFLEAASKTCVGRELPNCQTLGLSHSRNVDLVSESSKLSSSSCPESCSPTLRNSTQMIEVSFALVSFASNQRSGFRTRAMGVGRRYGGRDQESKSGGTEEGSTVDRSTVPKRKERRCGCARRCQTSVKSPGLDMPTEDFMYNSLFNYFLIIDHPEYSTRNGIS